MSYIYIAESGCGYCKVGKSIDPVKRMQTVKSETGLTVTRFEYFKCEGDSLSSESHCHKLLSDNSVFGEWFNIDFDKACELAVISSGINFKNNRVDCGTKINLSCPEQLSKDLKEKARSKGMKFHAFLVMELEKINKRK